MFGDNPIGRDASGGMHNEMAQPVVVKTVVASSGGVHFTNRGQRYTGDSVKLVAITKNGKRYFKVYGRSPIVDSHGNIVTWNILYDAPLEVVGADGRTLLDGENSGIELPSEHVEPLLYLMEGAPRPPPPSPTKPETPAEGKESAHTNPDRQQTPADVSNEGKGNEVLQYGRDKWEHYNLVLTDADTNQIYTGAVHVVITQRDGKTFMRVLGASKVTSPDGTPAYGTSFHHVLKVKSNGHTYEMSDEGDIEVPSGKTPQEWFESGMPYVAPPPPKPVQVEIVSQTTSTPFYNHSEHKFIDVESGEEYYGFFKVTYWALSDGTYQMQYVSQRGVVLKDKDSTMPFDVRNQRYIYTGDNPQEYNRQRFHTFKTMSDEPPRTAIVRQYDYSHTYTIDDIAGVRWKVHDNLYLNNQTDIHVRVYEHNDRTKTVQFYVYDRVGSELVKVPIEPQPIHGNAMPFVQSSAGYREYTLPSDVQHPQDLNTFIRSGMTSTTVPDPDDSGDDDNKTDDDSKDDGKDEPDTDDDSGKDDGGDATPSSSPASEDSPIFVPPDDNDGKRNEDNNQPVDKSNPAIVGLLLTEDEFYDDIFQTDEEILGFCFYQDENAEMQEAQQYNQQDVSDSPLMPTGRRCLQEFGDSKCGEDEIKPTKVHGRMPIPVDSPPPDDNPPPNNDEIPPDDDDVTTPPTDEPQSGTYQYSEYVPPEPVQRQVHAPAPPQSPILSSKNIDYEIAEAEKERLTDFADFYSSSLSGEEANDEIFDETFTGVIEEDDPMVEEWSDKQPSDKEFEDYKWNAVFAQLAYVDGSARVSKFYGFEYDTKLSTDDIAIYRNSSVNRIMVSFRGTELGDLGKSVSDIVNDLFIATSLERYSLRFRRAYDFVKKLQDDNPNQKITLSSHSLGASISTYVGKRLPDVQVFAYGTGTGVPFIEELLKGSEKTIENLSKGNPLFKIFIDTMFAEQGTTQDNNILHVRYFSDLVSVGRHFKANNSKEKDITLHDKSKILIKAHSISNFVDKRYRKVALPVGSKLEAKYAKQQEDRLKHVHP